MRPLKFYPQLHEKIWGGERIASFKPGVCTESRSIGESWELSGLRGYESVVRGGEEEGLTLGEVIARRGRELLGEAVLARFDGEFPLLVKLIDTKEKLSIQVHPDDELARTLHGSRGKSELWYVIDAEPESHLYGGFNCDFTPELYDRALAEGRIEEYLQVYEARVGDAFFLPAGRVHSVGAGLLIAEIQQSSDLTYRIYDFERRDKQGHLRELHTAQARMAIDYRGSEEYRIGYSPAPDHPVTLIDNACFTTELHDLHHPEVVDLAALPSFVILVVVGGEGTLQDNEGNTLAMRRGETLLVPAARNKSR